MALFSCCFASGLGELTGLTQKLRVTGRISSRARISGSQPAYHVLWGSWRRGNFGVLMLLCLAKAIRLDDKDGLPLWDLQCKPVEDLRSFCDDTPKGSPVNTTLASFVLMQEILGAVTLEAHDVTREQSLRMLECIQLAWVGERVSPTN